MPSKQSLKAGIAKYFVNIWNVPNVLTMLRLALIPVFVALHSAGRPKLALTVFLLASFTDFLDGYLARKYRQITAFGKLMDPLADKVMVVVALLCQTLAGAIPLWALCVVALKELLMVAGGAWMLKQDVVVYSNLWGKTAQVAFIAALTLSFWHEEFAALGAPVDRWVLLLAVALALAALVDYALGAWRQLRAPRDNP